jgi:3-deoxy-D-manno-octulosonic-acid transferase
MLRAYRLLAWCGAIPLFAYLWWRGRKDPAYRERWRERLGHVEGLAGFRYGVLLHCASVGEVIAARPLIQQLLADAHWGPVVVSCTTPTGSRQITADFGSRVGHAYFPLDLPGATRRFLRLLQPRTVLLMERELWPEFLHQAQASGIPVVLVNARLSARSAAGYQRWSALMRPALASLRRICAEDAPTAARFVALGVAPQQVQITGNIKSDVQAPAVLLQTIADTRAALGSRPVLTAGSTHAGEDEALIDAFRRHLPHMPDTLLILVPRHPERFAVVAALLATSGLRVARVSLGQTAQPDTQVLLGDSMGELMRWYGVADACFIGGSLIPRQGHNPLEALCLDKPLLTGPHTANFATVFQALESADALLRVADADAVFTSFRALLQDAAAHQARIGRGRAVYHALGGALHKTLQAIRPLVAAFDATAAAPPRTSRQHGETVWADSCTPQDALHALFELDAWRQRGSVQQLGAGRGNIHRVADDQGQYLLRHYYRGGLMARISRDLFLAQPVAQSRAMQEFLLLRRLRMQGLPVPRPLAARYRRVALWYRADILVELIPEAVDTARLMHQQRSLSDAEWRSLGQAVRQLHDAQCFHSDLNCHNLMLDAQARAWIVDFDKCDFRAGADWKGANLERLHRSLRKELRLDPGFRWDETRWAVFQAGYDQPCQPDGSAAAPGPIT